MDHNNSWPFREAVDHMKVKDYYDLVKNPMDLGSVKKKLELTCKLMESSNGKGGIAGGILTRARGPSKGEELKDAAATSDNDQVDLGKHAVAIVPYKSIEEFRVDVRLVF